MFKTDSSIANHSDTRCLFLSLNPGGIANCTRHHLLIERMRGRSRCTAQCRAEYAPRAETVGVSQGVRSVVPGGTPQNSGIERNARQHIDALKHGKGWIDP